MKVLISWSGERSKAIAELLRRSLQPIVQSVEPWMSDSDIAAGQRWSASLAQQLSSCHFGVICVTPENMTAPWLMFEAGALAKSLGNGCVVPFLFRVKPTDLPGPLAQFQAVSADRDGFWRLVKSLSSACDSVKLGEDQLRHVFTATWPLLEKDLEEVKVDLKKKRPALPRQSANAHIFQAPETGKYNRSFYRFFRDRISNAKSDIYVTGDGFECADIEGKELAQEYNEAFVEALRNGVHVVRVQTKPTACLAWAELLARLVEEFPGNFSLFIVRKGKSVQLSSVCVIDPDNPGSNLVELMLSTSKFFGARAADLAGTAVFIEGQQAFAQDLRQRILGLADSDFSLNPSTPEEVVNWLAGERYYFAYGSNMSELQMKKRCPSASKVGVGVLRNHKIVFNRQGSYRPGGVASVSPTSGERVYGIIWSIHAVDFSTLDAREDPEAYRRSEIVVSTLDGEEYTCAVYKSIPQGEFFKPDADYIDLMTKSAAEAGLPEEYVQHLVEIGES